MRDNIKLTILFIVTVIILGFFDARAVSETDRGQLITLNSFIIVLIHIFYQIVQVNKGEKGSFVTHINLLLLAIFISMIPAYIYHGQSFFQSFKALRHFYVFFIYFILYKEFFTYDQILKLCKIFFFITLFIYIINYLTLPNAFFADKTFERRGTVTIRFAGQGFTILGTFYCLSYFFRTNKFGYFLLFIIGFCFAALFSASRVMLVSLIFNVLFLLYFYRRAIKRYFFVLIPLLIIVLSLAIHFLSGYVSNLYSLAVEELSTFDTNIRYLAMKYFTDDFQTDIVTKIFGNGFPQVSTSYGETFEVLNTYGFFTSDLGLIGLWVYFGVLSVVAWLMIFKSIFISSTNNYNIFIKTYFIFLFFTIFLGYPIFSPGHMITIVFCLYLFDKSEAKAIESS